MSTAEYRRVIANRKAAEARVDIETNGGEPADEVTQYEKALAAYLDAEVMSEQVCLATEAFMHGWNEGRAALQSKACASVAKPLDDPRLQQLFGDAIEGALAFGFQGNNAPPEGHWLARFWNIGRAEAAQQAAKSAAASDEWLRAQIDEILSKPENAEALERMGVRVVRLAAKSAAPAATRSDAQIVEQTERIAGMVASAFHGSKLTTGAYREASNPKAQKCWSVACSIQEALTNTDPMNAVAELEDAAPMPATQAPAAVGLTDDRQAFLDLAGMYCSITETSSGDLQWSFAQRDIENFASEIVDKHRASVAKAPIPTGAPKP